MAFTLLSREILLLITLIILLIIALARLKRPLQTLSQRSTLGLEPWGPSEPLSAASYELLSILSKTNLCVLRASVVNITFVPELRKSYHRLRSDPRLLIGISPSRFYPTLPAYWPL